MQHFSVEALPLLVLGYFPVKSRLALTTSTHNLFEVNLVSDILVKILDEMRVHCEMLRYFAICETKT